MLLKFFKVNYLTVRLQKHARKVFRTVSIARLKCMICILSWSEAISTCTVAGNPASISEARLSVSSLMRRVVGAQGKVLLL